MAKDIARGSSAPGRLNGHYDSESKNVQGDQDYDRIHPLVRVISV